MKPWEILLIVLVVSIVLVVIASILIFCLAFVRGVEINFHRRVEFELSEYRRNKKQMLEFFEKFKSQKFEEVEIKSYDGLTLKGDLLKKGECTKTIIFFHGYRSSAKNDFSQMLDFYKKMDYNLLFVNQRSHGKSKGRLITFGIREKYDVASWVEFLKDKLKQNEIVLVGMSMGASTVLMASNIVDKSIVKGIIADCGFDNVYGILQSVVRKLWVPFKFSMWCLDFYCRVFLKVEIKNESTENAVSRTEIPILYIHGTSDGFVPCQMTENNYNSTSSDAGVLFIENASHAGAYLTDKRRYENQVKMFLFTISD